MSNFMTPNTSTDCTHIDELSAMRNSSSPERKRARPTTDVTKTLLVDRTNTLSTHGREKAAELSQAVQEPVTTSSTPESAHRRRRLAGSGNDGAVTRGAWTKLTSIAQLEQLLHSQLLSIDTPAHQHLRFHSSAGKKGGKVSGELEQSAAPLALRAGETILIVLHKSADGLPPPEITADTESFSQLRVFSLNLATLPTLEYAGDASPQADSSNAVESSSAPPTSPPPATVDHVRAGDGEEEEEDTIIVTPATPVVVHRGTAPTREQTTPSSPTRHSTLSHCLSHAFDVVLERLRGLLRVSSLPPSTQTDESGNSTIPVPGLVLWRAGGAPETHYSPFPSASNTAPSVELQREQAAAVGGPLSMKLLNANNQVHSLSLYQQVYTMEGFMNTVYQSLPDVVEKAGKSHTIVYIGASWCPPCMRIVGKFAHLLQASMPTSVHCLVKADMDYAKDVVDFFGVEIVPTFIILDNQQLPKRDRVEEEQAAGGDGWKATVKSAVLGSLQNSDESTVALFFDKHCTGIQFDEDF